MDRRVEWDGGVCNTRVTWPRVNARPRPRVRSFVRSFVHSDTRWWKWISGICIMVSRRCT